MQLKVKFLLRAADLIQRVSSCTKEECSKAGIRDQKPSTIHQHRIGDLPISNSGMWSESGFLSSAKTIFSERVFWVVRATA